VAAEARCPGEGTDPVGTVNGNRLEPVVGGVGDYVVSTEAVANVLGDLAAIVVGIDREALRDRLIGPFLRSNV
jgi:hypothetical protein